MLCDGRRAAVAVFALCCALCAPLLPVKADADEEIDHNFLSDVYENTLKPLIDSGKDAGFKMAQKYHDERKYMLMEPEEKIVALRNEVCRYNGALGVAGSSASMIPGLGAISSAVSIASFGATVLASFRSQAMLAAGIASIKGYDVDDPKADFFILGLILGDAATVAMAKTAEGVGVKVGAAMLTSLPTSAVRLMQQQFGKGGAARLVGTGAGRKATAAAAVKTFGNFVPFMGALFAGGVDWGMCSLSGRAMEKLAMSEFKDTSDLKQLLLDHKFTKEHVLDVTKTLGFGRVRDLCDTAPSDLKDNLKDKENWKIGEISRLNSVLKIACADLALREAARDEL